MKYLKAMLIFSMFLFGQSGISKLKYLDPYDHPMTVYAEWSAGVTKTGFSIGTAYRTPPRDNRDPLVNIIVFAPIYPFIVDSLNTYITDIQLEGYDVQVDTVKGWNASLMRGHLAALLDSELVGAVLMGSIPMAWYEMESAEGREEFPIELYFMDLDGTWTDSDSDSLFDSHTGDRAPEIWVGRIYTASMTWGNEIFLLNNYLSKLHKYRIGGYNVPQKALAYVDDDWYSFNDCDLDYLYDTVTVVRNYNTTIASDFRSRLDDPYEWVQICSHSSPWANTFKNTSGYAGTVFDFELWFADAPFLFVNLFQCSGTRFIEENFVGGCYIYGSVNGLLAIGSTKVGSMLHFSDFYGPLNTGISVGEAFQSWFTEWGITDEDWFYGMCICGDPLLKPMQSGFRYAAQRKRVPEMETISGWSAPEPVDLHTETDAYVSATTDAQGRIWASWVTGRSVTYGRTEICASRRQGGSWTAPVVVSPFEYWDFTPALTCDASGMPTLMWSRCYGRNYDIFFSSYEGGAWTTAEQVSSKASNDMYPAMVLDGDDRLWVTLERWEHLNGDIYCRYHDGVDWHSMFAVSVDSFNDYRPSMAVDNTGRAWVAWTSERYQYNRNIYVKSFNPASGHWENLKRITSNSSQDQDAKICVDGSGNVWVSWTTWRHGNSDIYESHYDGTSWSSPHAVTSDPGRDERASLIADQDGFIWCIWQSDRTGDWEVMAKYYKDGEWRDSAYVSNDGHKDVLPAVTQDDSGYIWILWQTNRNSSWDIYASRILADLVEPQVAVVSANGGEVWNIGEIDTIRWIASDNTEVDSVSIFYSTDNGASWLDVAHGEANDSAYAWSVPATPSYTCLIKIVAFDRFPNSSEDISDGVFTIRDPVPPEAVVICPNGGEVFYTGEVDTIRWSATDNIALDSVSLEFSPDSGTSWEFVAAPSVGDSAYEWIIPSVHSTECLVRVRAFDVSDNMGQDVSDSLFSIVDNVLPVISVVVPNGGEVWYHNETRTIRWSAYDNVGFDSMDVHLSLDAGMTYPFHVAHITGYDSIYEWVVPETTSYTCLMRVGGFDTGGNSAYDHSDSVFTIGELGIGQTMDVPAWFAVRAPFPNPWIEKFSIRLQVPAKQHVGIAVYDAGGRFVGRVVDQELAPGMYDFTWGSKGIPSGIYFIRLESGDNSQILKVIHIQ